MAGSDTQNAPYLTKEAQETQRRLLDAAEEFFAEKGFDGATIRDITTRAERNPAAVNYFFGNKYELYEELFRRRLRQMRESRLNAIKTVMSDKPTLEKLLNAYSVDFLEPFSDPQLNRRFMKLFFRELAEQQLPENMFLDEMASPAMVAMEDALAVLCPTLSKHDAQMGVLSVTGQLVHIMQVKALFEGGQEPVLGITDIEKTINHIVKFSAAGIRAFTQGSQK